MRESGPAHSALIVDDERDIRELLVLALTRMGLRVETAATVAAARRQLAGAEFDFCLSDMRLPDGDGMQLLAYIREHHAQMPVAMITAFGNVESAVEALKAGAFDFVAKPVDLHVLRALARHALRLRQARDAASPHGGTDGKAEACLARLIGTSPSMQQLRELLRKVARSQAPVHIHGESGTGKELAARSIHQLGARAAGPFVPVNCGAIPGELMESEFFGHRKGSFTGAHADKQGLFQAAHGGTLFLDEVAELPLAMQVKLLRAIQEKQVRAIGDATETPVDVRILSATHAPLLRQVESGAFRHDLYYRINVIEVRMPPLRERGEDLPVLAQALLQRLAARHGLPTPRLQPDALQALVAYPFPGNVRELENVLERALTLAEGAVIEAGDLRLPIAAGLPAAATPAALPEALERIEREAIQQALSAHRYNKTRTAQALGISFRALRYKLKKLGIA